MAANFYVNFEFLLRPQSIHVVFFSSFQFEVSSVVSYNFAKQKFTKYDGLTTNYGESSV